jgi:hypothetical protein
LKFDSSRDQRDFYLFIYLFIKNLGEYLIPCDKKEKASATDTKAFFFFSTFFFLEKNGPKLPHYDKKIHK